MVAVPPQHAHALDGQQVAYYVGQRKYRLDPLPAWKRLFFWYVWMPMARFVYRRLGLPIVDHLNPQTGEMGWVEDQSICRFRDCADRMLAGKRLYFVKELPVDVCLPAETSQFGFHSYPNSGAHYEQRRLSMVAMRRDVVEEFDAHLDALTRNVAEVQKLRDTLGGRA